MLSSNLSRLITLTNKFRKLLKNNKVYIFAVTSTFYLLLWIVNPSNKIIAASFIFLLAIYYRKTKDFRLSLLITYFSSSIVLTGKQYVYELIPPGIYPLDLYPRGYLVSLAISPKHLILSAMLILVIRDIVTNKKFNFKIDKIDLLLVLYFFWVILTDIIVSKRLGISLFYSLLYMEGLVLYIFTRFYILRKPRIYSFIIYVFMALVFVQSFVVFQQFQGSAPVGKSIESQTNIEYFGHSADELLFRYRPVGTLYHANMLGIWLVYFLSIFGVYILRKESKFISFIFTFGLITIVLTLSRSAWVSSLVSLLTALYIYEKIKKKIIKIPRFIHKNKIGIILLTIGIFVFFVFPRLSKSIYSFGQDEGGGYLRTEQIIETTKLILLHPIFGTGSKMSLLEGLLSFPTGIFGKIPLFVHNWYMLIMIEHGVPALIFFLMFVILSLKRIYNIISLSNKTNLLELLSVGMFSGIVGLLIAGFFQPYIAEELIMFSAAFWGIKRN
jgi:hypothetical protein